MLRYIQFILFFVISISCNSQELVQIASYKQVELKLPSTWNFKSQEIESDFAYQISCWEKGGSNSFVFQWIETEMNMEEYLETMKESLKEQITHKNAIFTDNKADNFQNNKTLYSTFVGELLDFKFSGKLIVFNNNGRTFLIMHQGDDEFYKVQTADKIISTLKVGFLRETAQSEIPKTWTLFEIENIGQLAIPPSLELRDDNSFTALAADIIYDSYVTHKKIKMTKSQLVFQPKGSNELDKEAFSKYSRILINYNKGEYGDFYKWNEKYEFTNSEYKELDEYFKDEVVTPMTLMNIKLINWYPLEFGNVNGLSYIKISFTRQMANNPIVKVIGYKFFNTDEAVEITLSYRLSESEIWEADFSKVINTFSFKTKK
ncbi:MAG: hypothetical protein EOL97_14755 [Spirochaetia bacterium]|nr:hypothetical protein [Spirochaetia bacterium]